MRRPYVGLKPARLLRYARNDNGPLTLTLSLQGRGFSKKGAHTGAPLQGIADGDKDRKS